MKKLIAVSVVLLACGAMAFGSGQQSTDVAAPEAAGAVKPITISILLPYSGGEPIPPEHEIFKMIKEETGATFDMMWVPEAARREKVNLMLASGNLPQVFNVKDIRDAQFLEAQQAGIFWELTDELLAKFPLYLSKMDKNICNNMRIDGKLYGIYQERPIGRQAIIYRKDWITKLGLPLPDSVENIDKIARAFASKDPDGNGKDDTYGLFETKGLNAFRLIQVGLGGPNVWKEQNGKFTPYFTDETFMPAINMFRGWYKDKVLNQDFVSVNSTQDKWNAFIGQKSGMMLNASLDDSLKIGDVKANDPNALIAVLPIIKTQTGKEVINGGLGYNGAFLFPKKTVKTEAELIEILKVLDKINEPKGKLLNAMVWGLEGRHFTRENGVIIQTEVQKNLRNKEINNFVLFRSAYDFFADMNAKVSDLQRAVYDGWAANSKVVVLDPTAPLVSQTYIDKGKELDKIYNDAITKYIMGLLDEAGMKKEFQRWSDGGGAGIIKDYETSFAKAKK